MIELVKLSIYLVLILGICYLLIRELKEEEPDG